VAEHSIFTSKEAAFLRALVDAEVEFMIVGLSAALLQGAPAVTQSVDLWLRDLRSDGLLPALKKVGGALVPQIGLHPPMLAGDAVKMFDLVLHMSGLDAWEVEAARAIEMDVAGVRVKVLPLDRVIASKEAADREKDRLVLPVLRDAAVTIREARPPQPRSRKK